MQLRPYQREALEAAKRDLYEFTSTLLVLPTGTGKTVVFATLGHEWTEGRVLILAHREELVNQAVDKVTQVTGERPDVEMADQVATAGIWGGSKIVVGSVASLFRDSRLERFDPDEFGLVVTDEAKHDVPSNSMYRKIRQHFSRNGRCRFLGVDATPDRGDGQGLKGHYESVCYSYDLPDAIDDGWLVKILQRYVVCNHLDLSKAKTSKGDFTDKSLDEIMTDEHTLHEVVSPTLELAGSRQTLVFAASIHHAERMAEIFNRHKPGSAAAVHGGNDEYRMKPEVRRDLLARYSRQEFQYLITVDIAYEGYDEPTVQCVANARITKSRSRYAQAVGRGTRLLDNLSRQFARVESADERKALIAASAKPDLLVLDFVGNSTQHKLSLGQVSTMDLLAGRASHEARQRAARKVKESGGSADMREAVAEAELEIAHEQQREREAAEKRKREKIVAKAEYEVADVDPFAGGDQYAAARRHDKRLRPPTSGQLMMLENNGVKTEGMTFGEADKICADIVMRSKFKLATLRQSEVLKQMGEHHRCAREKASALISIYKVTNKKRDFALTRDRLVMIPCGNGTVMPFVKLPDGQRVALTNKPLANLEACRAWLGKVVEKDYAKVA